MVLNGTSKWLFRSVKYQLFYLFLVGTEPWPWFCYSLVLPGGTLIFSCYCFTPYRLFVCTASSWVWIAAAAVYRNLPAVAKNVFLENSSIALPLTSWPPRRRWCVKDLHGNQIFKYTGNAAREKYSWFSLESHLSLCSPTVKYWSYIFWSRSCFR